MKTKDENFTFFYPVLISEQIAFRDDGTTYTKKMDNLGEGHILHQGRLMCGESMTVLKNRSGARKVSIKKVRATDKKLCPACQEKYKKNLDSAWGKWARGEAVKAGGTIEVVETTVFS
jgi:hypothetical protein